MTDDLPVGGAQIDTDGSARNHLGVGFVGGGGGDTVGVYIRQQPHAPAVESNIH